MSAVHSHEAGFSCVESFDIDDDELDGVRPDLAFVLGVEFAMFRSTLLSAGSDGFGLWVRRENKDRLIRMCLRHSRAAVAEREADQRVYIEVRRALHGVA